LADRIGRRKVFFAGVVIFTVSSALAGTAPTAGLLIGARVIQAVGAAALLPSSLALVLGEFPREKRATAVGIWGAVGALAAATGPTLGALIIDAASWRLAFFVNLPIGALTIFLGSRLLRESKDPDAAQRQDLLGIPLLIAGVGALALGIVQSDEWGWGGTRTLAAFAASAVILPLFILRSATYHSPALDLTLFRNRNFRMANLATASFGIAFAAMFLGTVLFLTNVWQYSILQAGLLIAPGPFIAGVVAGPAGSDRPEQFIPMLNAARSPTFYEFDAADLLRLYREMDQRDEDPVVIYHSHTATEAYPSRTDTSLAQEPRAHYVLVSTRDPDRAEFRSFRIVDGEVTEEPVQVVQSPPAADARAADAWAVDAWGQADRRHTVGHTPTSVVYDCPTS